jgi:hypothetical protein
MPKISVGDKRAPREDAETSVLGSDEQPGEAGSAYGAYGSDQRQGDDAYGGAQPGAAYSRVSAGTDPYGTSRTSAGTDPYGTARSGQDNGTSPYAARLGSSAASRWNAARTGAAAAAPQRPRVTSPRQARLTVSRFDTWSVMKFSFLISLVCFIILFVAVAVLYGMLDLIGVFSAIQNALSSVTSSQSSAGVSITKWLSASTILGWTAILGVLDVVLITLLSTVGAAIYNLVSRLVGGVEVTLRETE